MKYTPLRFLNTFNDSELFFRFSHVRDFFKPTDLIVSPFSTTSNLLQYLSFDEIKVKAIHLNTTYYGTSACLLVIRDYPDHFIQETSGFSYSHINKINDYYELTCNEIMHKIENEKIYKDEDGVKTLGCHYYLLNQSHYHSHPYLDISEDGLLKVSFFDNKELCKKKYAINPRDVKQLSKIFKEYNLTISDLHWKSYCFNALNSNQNPKWFFTLPSVEDNITKHHQFFKFKEQDLFELFNEILPLIDNKNQDFIIVMPEADFVKYQKELNFVSHNSLFKNHKSFLGKKVGNRFLITNNYEVMANWLEDEIL